MKTFLLSVLCLLTLESHAQNEFTMVAEKYNHSNSSDYFIIGAGKVSQDTIKLIETPEFSYFSINDSVPSSLIIMNEVKTSNIYDSEGILCTEIWYNCMDMNDVQCIVGIILCPETRSFEFSANFGSFEYKYLGKVEF